MYLNMYIDMYFNAYIQYIYINIIPGKKVGILATGCRC